MNTIKPLACCAALFAGWSAVCAQAGQPQQATLLFASAASGQASSHSQTGSAGDRREAERLLQQARGAMKDKNYDLADALITRAEAMKVDYGMLHLGDTPKKARHDLSVLKGRGGEPKRPSEGSKPINVDAPTGLAGHAPEMKPATPYTTNPEVMEHRDAQEELPPFKSDNTPKRFPAVRASYLEPPTNEADNDLPKEVSAGPQPLSVNDSPEARRRSDSLLHGARRALAVGDLKRASAQVDEAKSLHVPYGIHDDTPNKVESAIQKHSDVFASGLSKPESDVARHQRAALMLDEAQQLVRWHDMDEAERLVNDAQRLGADLSNLETTPDSLMRQIMSERRATAPSALGERPRGPAPEPIMQAERPDGRSQDRGALPGGAPRQNMGQNTDANPIPSRYPTTSATYDANQDQTRVRQAAAEFAQQPGRLAAPNPAEPLEQLPPTGDANSADDPADAAGLVAKGEEMLRNRRKDEALRLFRKAYMQRSQLDPQVAQRLQDHLQLLSAPPASRALQRPETLIDGATAEQKMIVKQISNEVARQLEAAKNQREKDPKGALETLRSLRVSVEASGLEPQTRAIMLARVERGQAELDKYIEENRSQIELDQRNKAIVDEVDRRRKHKLDIDNKLAKLVDDYNHLMEERRTEEAELLAKKAREIDPDNVVVMQLVRESSAIRAYQNEMATKERKEDGFLTALHRVDEAAIQTDPDRPYQFGTDAKTWQEYATKRGKYGQAKQRMTEKELDIYRKLSTPVTARFHDRPLGEVLDQLTKLAGVNLHLDQRGLTQEGVSSDTPVTIDLNQDISLKSALRLILDPLNLSYVIKNEVLNITSEQLRNGEVYEVVYNVADLVIPIPNFAPSSEFGLNGALHDAYAHLGVGQPGGFGQGGGATALVASQDGNSAAKGVIDPKVLAQMQGRMNPALNSMNNGMGQPMAAGGPAAGGGLQPDFDSLVSLITTVISPQTWDEVGGQGSISAFRPNLSLVISQTQDVHDQLVDLFDQLRRLQDLQVTIEVRFITLNDNFFERIGVDFQFNIEDHATTDLNAATKTPSAVVGIDPNSTGTTTTPPAFTVNKDIQFRQGSFGLGIPQFGGFDPASSALSAGRFGFAILSDLEAYFLVNAAQGDKRGNVMQAPKVTLFNGQQASVFDQTYTPFVISVIPVVGDFAAAQQPVIVVLAQGTFLSVQAVVSANHRFVRLTVAPMFSQIGEVDTFTFSGSSTTTKNTSGSNSTTAGGDKSNSDTDNETTTTEGVTVQLPSLAVVSVVTTVSVPDGGTVLLGGIKRLSEGRSEFGVPILSKLPYINRLFKNVGIGRDTQSLMMMVTPRIIIQEEEEAALGIQQSP